uniref:Uncharacterized protein n=1 Tax=Ditylum brightwellii TaxID=49249 RepID=A0A6V2CE93_9STRA
MKKGKGVSFFVMWQTKQKRRFLLFFCSGINCTLIQPCFSLTRHLPCIEILLFSFFRSDGLEKHETSCEVAAKRNTKCHTQCMGIHVRINFFKLPHVITS